MCGTTSKGITRLLPITGTSTLPMGTALYLPLARRRPARKVGDPDHREDHVEHYHGYHQETYNDYVGPPAHAVRRLFVQPRDREQPDNEEAGQDHIRDGDERRAGEEDQPLIQEKEEPFGTGHIDRGTDLRRLREGGRNPVGEDYDHHQKNCRDGKVRDNLPREEPLGLVVAVEDILLRYLFFLNRWLVLGFLLVAPYVNHLLLASSRTLFVFLLFEILSHLPASAELRQPLGVLEGRPELAVLAKQVQVETDQRSQRRRQEPHVDGEHPREGSRSRRVPAQQKRYHPVPDQRRVGGYLHADFPGVEALHVPAQGVAGERQYRNYKDQENPDHPVHLPWWLVGAGEKGPYHVQADHEQQHVGRPEVDTPDVLPEVSFVHDVVDRIPRLVRARHVVEEKQDAGEELQCYEEERRAPYSVEPLAPLGRRLVE